MELAVVGPEYPIHYSPKLREFGVRILDGGSSRLMISFCPWCGQKLPDSLRDDWFDRLENLGIHPSEDEVPAEFTDDRWWRDQCDG